LQLPRFHLIAKTASAITAALFRCQWSDEASSKPTRFTSTVRGIQKLGHAGWPRFDKLGNYVGPLPRRCGHSHNQLIGKLPDGNFATSGSGAFGSKMSKSVAEVI
jgi:hypothetical protein